MDGNGVMRYGELSQDAPDSTAYYEEYSQRICWKEGGRNCNVPVTNESLGQFTGVCDKNGKEIYGGDIVEVGTNGRPNKFVVKFGLVERLVSSHDAKSWFPVEISCFYFEGVDGLPYFSITDNFLGGNDLEITEVIGNIHENQELWK